MYEEPYRWIEAVGNRRHYLNEQFRQGSPVVGLSYSDGVLLLTVSKGTPKLYEIYDRVALAGMGHPADLEKLRFSLLEMAHLEGFNRSPSDVTAARLMKYGLAPAVKQAFEEIYKAPFIVKILLADLSLKSPRDGRPQDTFLTIDYDGSFEETTGCAVLAASPAVGVQMLDFLRKHTGQSLPGLDPALDLALQTWAVGSLAQAGRTEDHEEARTTIDRPAAADPTGDDPARLAAHLREVLPNRTIEAAVLDRRFSGPSKYRPLKPDELARLVPQPVPVS